MAVLLTQIHCLCISVLLNHSVDKCIAEAHADIECINSLQGTTATCGNPSRLLTLTDQKTVVIMGYMR